MNFLSQLKNWIFSITKKDIVYSLVIILLVLALSMSVERCSKVNHEYKNNIEALKDTIHYYKAKNGNLVATKLAFESDIKTLKLLNEELYDEIENLKAKSDVTSATYFTGVIENEVHDTTYIINHDTISKGFNKEFTFTDEYSNVEGNVNYQDDTLGVSINKNEMKFDYTVAMDKKNNIYITSTNPHVKYNQITGFQVPTPKKKHWFFGPSINLGYGATIHDGKVVTGPNISVGVSGGYILFSK